MTARMMTLNWVQDTSLGAVVLSLGHAPRVLATVWVDAAGVPGLVVMVVLLLLWEEAVVEGSARVVAGEVMMGGSVVRGGGVVPGPDAARTSEGTKQQV